MKLIALQCFRNGKVRYLPGDVLDLESMDARALIAQGLVEGFIEDAVVVSTNVDVTPVLDEAIGQDAPVLVSQNSLELLDGTTPAILEKLTKAGFTTVEQLRGVDASELALRTKVSKSVAQRLISSAENDFSDED